MSCGGSYSLLKFVLLRDHNRAIRSEPRWINSWTVSCELGRCNATSIGAATIPSVDCYSLTLFLACGDIDAQPYMTYGCLHWRYRCTALDVSADQSCILLLLDLALTFWPMLALYITRGQMFFSGASTSACCFTWCFCITCCCFSTRCPWLEVTWFLSVFDRYSIFFARIVSELVLEFVARC